MSQPPDIHVAKAWKSTVASTPMLWPAMAFTLGIIISTSLGSLFNSTESSPWIWGCLFVAGIVSAIFISYRRQAAGIAVALSFLTAGGLDVALRSTQRPHDSEIINVDEKQTITGLVTETSIHSKTVRIIVSSSDVPGTEGPVQVAVTTPITPVTEDIHHGDSVCVTGLIQRPWAITDVEEEIPLSHSLISRGIDLQMLISDDDDHDQVAILSRAHGLLARTEAIGRHSRWLIDRSFYLTAASKDFLKAILTGDAKALSEPSREMFTAAGLAHLLALSGTHVGILIMILSVTMWPIMFCGFRRTTIVVIIACLWMFAICTGMSVSVVRAVVMASVMMLARLFQRQASSLNSLLTAALIILAVVPGQLYDIGFQLSFAAVGSILLFAAAFNPILRNHSAPWLLRAVMSFLGVSIAANLGAGAVAAYHFHFFPVMFLLSNAIATITLPLILAMGLIFIIGQWVGLDFPVLAYSINFCYGLMLHAVDYVAALPAATIDRIYFPAWLFLPYIAALVTLKLALISRHRFYRPIYVCLTLVFLSTCFTVAAHESNRIYPDEWIITRSPRKATEIVIRHANHIYLYTSAPPHRHAEMLEHLSMRYADYAARRGVDSFAMLQPGTTDSIIMFIPPSTLIIGCDTVFVASSRQKIDPRLTTEIRRQRCNYLIYGTDCHIPLSTIAYSDPVDTLIKLSPLSDDELLMIQTLPTVSHLPSSSPWRRPIRVTPYGSKQNH